MGKEPVRVFLSHKSSVKVETSQVKKALAAYGLAAFVAHEDIEPNEEWHREIERALFSMDVLVALLTPDYHNSNWTDQEVGVAVGRGVPIVAVRLGLDPYGLISKHQGLGGCKLSDPRDLAAKVFSVLQKRLPNQEHLFESAVAAYSRSTSFADSAANAKRVFSGFEKVSQPQIESVLKAYAENDQNMHSFAGRSVLMLLLRRWTGKTWKLKGDLLVPEEPIEPESPF